MSNHTPVIVITGASSGIGEALARQYATQGAAVVLAARNREKMEAITAGWTNPFLIVQADISKEQDAQRLISDTVQRFGGIDVLINNAGISMRALFHDADTAVLRQLMDINFWGTVYCTKYALPYLLQSKGTVAGVSSIAGYRGLPGRTGYSASKFAMQGFLEALRTEHLKDGLHVLVACPGFTASNIRNTALTANGAQQGESPLSEGRLMTAEAVADHIIRAIQRRQRTLILTTQGKLTVFLNKWLPRWMDNMVYNHFAREADSPLRK
jgi:short-subunit dehydrogenase